MIEDLAALTGPGQAVLWQAFSVFFRIGAMVAFLPAFGEQSVPVRVKLAIALAFTAIVTPAISPMQVDLDSAFPLTLILSETVTGVFFGLMLRLFVMTLQVAGAIAAQSTSLAQLFGGGATDPLPAMGHVLVIGGLALAASMNLHVEFAAFMIHSYVLVPQGQIIPAEVLTPAGMAEISRAFALGFTLAAPFVIASLLYNVTLGVINKAMPQLMVAFVGAPAITAGGLVLLMLSAPLMLSLWLGAMGDFLQDPFRGP